MLLLFSHQSTFLLSYDDVKAKLNPIAYRVVSTNYLKLTCFPFLNN